MHFQRSPGPEAGELIVSAILNCVCPQCGGRMGGPKKAFKCQGRCQRDWQAEWESLEQSSERISPTRARR